MLRQYKDEPHADRDEDVSILFEDQARQADAASNLTKALYREFQDSHRKHLTLANLVDEVEAEYVPEDGDPCHRFLPYDTIQLLVTQERLSLLFRDEGFSTERSRRLMNFIFETGAQRLFLIVAAFLSDSIDTVAALLEGLQEDGVIDSSLPMEFDYRGRKIIYGYSVEKPENERRNFTVFANWDFVDGIHFRDHKWTFIAAVFDLAQFRYYFNKERILPYLTLAPRLVSNGFLGEVYKVEVHAAHISAMQEVTASSISKNCEVRKVKTDNSSVCQDERGIVEIALRRANIDADLVNFFDTEAANLDSLLKYSSEHLIKPIAAYQLDGWKYLVFPWPNGGNLIEYWQAFESHRTDRQSVIWIITQFLGIFSMLMTLHEYNYPHGDLKPEKILWTKHKGGYGNFQVTLDGSNCYQEEPEAMMRYDKRPTTSSLPIKSRYRAPMRGKSWDGEAQFDIWSFGCIAVELLVWLVYGAAPLMVFRKQTPHFWEKKAHSEGSEN